MLLPCSFRSEKSHGYNLSDRHIRQSRGKHELTTFDLKRIAEAMGPSFPQMSFCVS